MTQISLPAAQENLAELIESALRGEEVVITVDDKPAVRLVPSAEATESGFGRLRGLIKIADDFDEPLEDFEPYMQ